MVAIFASWGSKGGSTVRVGEFISWHANGESHIITAPEGGDKRVAAYPISKKQFTEWSN